MKKLSFVNAAVYDPLNPDATYNPQDSIVKQAHSTLRDATEKVFRSEVEKFWIESLVHNSKLELVISEGGSSCEEENIYHLTRYQDTIDLARRIAWKKADGKNYEQIAAEFNQQLKDLGIHHKVKSTTLRKVISRTYKKIDKEKLQYFMEDF